MKIDRKIVKVLDCILFLILQYFSGITTKIAIIKISNWVPSNACILMHLRYEIILIISYKKNATATQCDESVSVRMLSKLMYVVGTNFLCLRGVFGVKYPFFDG